MTQILLWYLHCARQHLKVVIIDVAFAHVIISRFVYKLIDFIFSLPFQDRGETKKNVFKRVQLTKLWASAMVNSN